MAKRKSSKNASLLGVVLMAALLGVVIGGVVYHTPGEPLPSPDDIKFTDPYDDTLGKLDQPAPRGSVSQIFLAINDTRTEEQAKEQIEQIWHRFRSSTWETPKWQELQDRHNEEDDKRKIYPFPGGPNELFETGRTTEVKFARITKSDKGYHLVRRES